MSVRDALEAIDTVIAPRRGPEAGKIVRPQDRSRIVEDRSTQQHLAPLSQIHDPGRRGDLKAVDVDDLFPAPLLFQHHLPLMDAGPHGGKPRFALRLASAWRAGRARANLTASEGAANTISIESPAVLISRPSKRQRTSRTIA